MSIICMTYVPDGIVMSADSRLTTARKVENESVVFTLTDNAQKVILLNKIKVGILFCGSAFIENRSIFDYLRMFEIRELGKKDTITSVAEKLYNAVMGIEDVTFLVGGYSEDIPYVYEVCNGRLNRLNADRDCNTEYGSCWNGKQEAINKLIRSEPATVVNFDSMPLKDAIDFSEFLVDVTIKYERFNFDIQTCGGDIDTLVLTKDSAFWHKHKVYKK